MKARGRIKLRTGVVVSDKLDKAIVVRIDRTAKHPQYKRVVKISTKVMAHDKKNEAKIGDRVRLQEVRPMSKNTRWRLVEVLK